MPSPFPGMDPWLESPTEWHGLHLLLVSATTSLLQPRLKERGYYAFPGDRVWLTEPQRPIYPDTAILQLPRRPRADRGGLAVLDPDEPVRISRAELEIHEPFIEIYDGAGHRLVTGIEFISPTNKSDSQGRELYLRKQQETRDAGVNLVEIDLIRRGPQVIDVPEHLLHALPRWDYLVSLGRRKSPDYELYPIRLRDRLPRIRIPLKQGDEDEVLDLQAAFDQAWVAGPYPERLDYNRGPSTPLAEDDAAWADQLLRDKGFRQ